MKTKAQALEEAGAILSEFYAVFMTQTPEEAAARAWQPDGPFTLEELTVKCAALQAKLRRGTSPTEE